jgi:hypothetical protein
MNCNSEKKISAGPHSIKVLLAVLWAALLAPVLWGGPSQADARTIRADVVAMDHAIVYNRFGSLNPLGMIYALKRDVVLSDGTPLPAGDPVFANAGNVRLRDDKRPRPLVLRANAGDMLEIHFTNLLDPVRPSVDIEAPGCALANTCDGDGICEEGEPCEQFNNTTATRDASILVSHLDAEIGDTSGGYTEHHYRGISGIAPGETIIYRWVVDHVGMHIFQSYSAPAGGEGDGGQLVLGLYGAVVAEPTGSTWYRSQVTGFEMDEARAQINAEDCVDGDDGCVDDEICSHAEAEAGLCTTGDDRFLNYDATYPTNFVLGGNAVSGDNPRAGDPIIGFLKPLDCTDDCELVHGDLNAIVTGVPTGTKKSPGDPEGDFREFNVVFQDEHQTVHVGPLKVLSSNPILAGVKDGFGINYGVSGLGAPILAHRFAEFGEMESPAADCIECAYEEFFLTSWAIGDPALLPQYGDDPSNVHHSYLGDNVLFRNTHMGPKETHVFHLHAHQWLTQQPSNSGTYLDSQTVAPQMTFNYPIFYGGSGNRNRTVGDAIFHCHLYPHFAQGMWELWRTHDVFEDGHRKLPDGLLGAGTDPITGETTGGTPIPAVVPMPNKPMAPQPTYGGSEAAPEGFPGYPFYIAGEAGHRPPQPPLDIHESGGLPRHVVTGGTMEILHPEQSLAQFDFSHKITSANIKLLPNAGTPLEQKAMAFHAKSDGSPTVEGHSHPTRTPESSQPAYFLVNGLPAAPGAPFADPCPPTLQDGGAPWWREDTPSFTTENRDYHVSAIELDLLVSASGWHDPQARINVLDRDVGLFEGPGAKTASPFFFRANSGECVQFFHTNRTPKDLKLDDFQVETPTDTIGQHIHLVKFDVTASDGSGNGWNYEDGTFAREAVVERIDASKAPGGSVVNFLEEAQPDLVHDGNFQTTIQRWWADPLYDKDPSSNVDAYDRTIRTVFTHDHFGPSSIQQHGFYNALVIEPAGSEWLNPQGGPLDPAATDGRGQGIGTQAMIVGADDPVNHPDHREFMMAVADFALLYDANGKPIDPPKDEQGNPQPEAISKDHHNPYLANYRTEPPGQRIGQFNDDGTFNGLKPGDAGDMAYVFDSLVHGDPFTEVYQAYKSDPVQVRIIQGAQEVQHVATIHGLNWKRDTDNPDSPLIGAQELGISEHFEFEIPNFPLTPNGSPADYLYTLGTIDSLWNGTWGIMRTLPDPPVLETMIQCLNEALAKPNRDPNTCKKARRDFDTMNLPIARLPSNPLTVPYNGTASNVELEAALTRLPPGTHILKTGGLNPNNICPTGAPIRTFEVEAWSARDLPLPGGKVIYNTGYDPDGFDPSNSGLLGSPTGEHISDPSGMFYVLTNENGTATSDKAELIAGTRRAEPLVLRARAGDCIQVTLTNTLPNDGTDWPDHPGDAEFPRIFGRTETGGLNADSFRPSKRVSMHAAVLASNILDSDGTNSGFNRAGGLDQTVPPQGSRTYTWFAGTYEFDQELGFPKIKTMVHRDIPFGSVNLTSAADTLKQVPQGLIGMLVVEPKDATWTVDPDGENTRLVAQVTYDGGAADFKEMVVIYQDGLNLLYGPGTVPGDFASGTQNIPNCHVCDDSYDRGEQAFSYRTDPFWARLGDGLVDKDGSFPSEGPLGCEGEGGGNAPCDTFDSIYPEDFFLEAWKPIEVPKFYAATGENVRFRLGQPGGLARQNSFTVGGHYYHDYGIPGFGSPGTSLIASSKSTTADLAGGAKDGHWIIRSGAQYHWAGGMWAQLTVGTPPPGPLTVSITSPTNNSTVIASPVDVTGTVNEDADSVTVNGVLAVLTNGLFTASGVTLSEGSNTLTATATRASDNATDSVNVTLDTSAPPPPALAVAITSPAHNSVVNTTTLLVNGNVTDDADLVTVKVDGVDAGVDSSITGGQFSVTINLASGDKLYTLEAIATRASDNATDSVTVILDTAAPVPVITSPVDGDTVTSNKIDVSGTVTDDNNVVSVVVGGVEASINNSVSPKTFIARNVPLAPGPNTLDALATDVAGNAAISEGITVNYDAPCRGKGCNGK